MAILTLLCPAFAEDGRDFSAIYDFKNVEVVDPTHVSVTLVLRLQNHSGADVAAGQVSLRRGMNPSQSYGAFSTSVTVANRAVTKLTGTFVVDAEEYQLWQSGPSPMLRIDYGDGEGRPMLRPVEVVRRRGMGDVP